MVRPLFCGIALILLMLLTEGCNQARPLNMQPQEVRSPTKEEGIVIGSVRMSGGWDIFGRKRWALFACKADQEVSYFFSNPSGEQYRLVVERDGPEAFFVAKLPAGGYRIHELLSMDTIGMYVNFDTGFRVKPGKITYVGRLCLEWKGPIKQISAMSSIHNSIVDAKKETLERLKKEYDPFSYPIDTDLMEIRDSGSNPEADAVFRM